MTDTVDNIENGKTPAAPPTGFGMLSEEEMKKLAMSVKNEDLLATVGTKLPANAPQASMDEIIGILKEIYDPEIPINIYDLGLIYKLEQSADGDVYIEMTLTAPTCPIAGEMPTIVAASLACNDKIGQVTVKIVWEPVWDLSKLSDDAKEILEAM